MAKLKVSTNDLFLNDDLLDAKTCNIAQELAEALNYNSVVKIKELKNAYGLTDEFAKAKSFLNNKCKEVWNPFEKTKLKVPKDAMKCLGITNQPSLDFLLHDSMRYFEKTNGNMTVKIIESILNNPNLFYSIDDIHRYFVNLYNKEKCCINKNTIQYLITNQNYDMNKLNEIGIKYNNVAKQLSAKEHLKHACLKIKQALKNHGF